MADTSMTANGAETDRFVMPPSLLRREILIGPVARAYLLAVTGTRPEVENLHGSIVKDIVQRLGLLADEVFAVLPLTIRRSRSDADAGSFEAELRIINDARPHGGPVIQATSSPLDGIRLGDFSLMLMKDRFPESTLASLKRRSEEDGITVGDVITTGMPLIDEARLLPYQDYRALDGTQSLYTGNATFRLASADIPVSDFIADLLRPNDPDANGDAP